MDQPRFLTYQHWTGLSPYISLFRFAGTYVLAKQLDENLLLYPPIISGEEHLAKLTLSCIAEFLEPSLLVCLGLLDLKSTCVGFGTDFDTTPYLIFPGDLNRHDFLTLHKNFHHNLLLT